MKINSETHTEKLLIFISELNMNKNNTMYFINKSIKYFHVIASDSQTGRGIATLVCDRLCHLRAYLYDRTYA